MEAARPQWDVQVRPLEGGPALVATALSGGRAPGMRSPRATETGHALLAAGAAAAAMGLQRQPLVAAAEVLSGGFDAVLPPVTGTLATPRSALRGAGTPAQARSVSFAEGLRGDARECLTRARRERRAERVARRPTRASRVVVEESARPRTPPRHMGARAPCKPTGGVTGPGFSTRPGTSWLMAGLGRSMLTGPDSLVTEFISALRTM